MTHAELDRFAQLRADLFDAIAAQLASDGHCKSYEGRLAIHFPNYFHERAGETCGWHIELHCYVVGPSRHYEWDGDTFEIALWKAEHDVRRWIAEARVDDEA